MTHRGDMSHDDVDVTTKVEAPHEPNDAASLPFTCSAVSPRCQANSNS